MSSLRGLKQHLVTHTGEWVRLLASDAPIRMASVQEKGEVEVELPPDTKEKAVDIKDSTSKDKAASTETPTAARKDASQQQRATKKSNGGAAEDGDGKRPPDSRLLRRLPSCRPKRMRTALYVRAALAPSVSIPLMCAQPRRQKWTCLRAGRT